MTTLLIIPSVVLIVRCWSPTPAVAGVFLAVLLGLGLSAESPPLFSDGSYGLRLGQRETVGVYGIKDERAHFYQSTGLLSISHRVQMPDHPWARKGTEARARGPAVLQRTTLGLFGFYAGPEVHIVDTLALSDPLLARIPMTYRRTVGAFPKIGHFPRKAPAGYLASLKEGRNLIEHPGMAELYDKLSVVTRGDLFSAARWVEIWRLNTGYYDDRIEDYVELLKDSAEEDSGLPAGR